MGTETLGKSWTLGALCGQAVITQKALVMQLRGEILSKALRG